MLDIVKRYTEGLEQAYRRCGGEVEAEWNEFASVKTGASAENIARIKEIFPEVPQSLLDLMEFADGTHFRTYGSTKVSLYFLGSELKEYPYYLLSSEKIIQNQNYAQEFYSEYIDREFDPEDIPIDDKIIDNSSKMRWLHFSDCMNNGGSSQLFIDFSPSPSGKVGQVVMFVHDPDEMEVIADSFDEYLEKLINSDFDFISDEWI